MPQTSLTPLIIVIFYLSFLLVMAFFSGRLFRGTSKDYFVASHSIGPFMLLMSVFGTTMTSFALVGSTGKTFQVGVGTYGLMASSSGLIHATCFFLIGIKVWAISKRQGFVTQIQFFRSRFESNLFGYCMFPFLIGLVIPYLLIGVMGSYRVIGPMTAGMFPNAFPSTNGAIPDWLTGFIICAVVLAYIFRGGSRAAAWANTFQTLVFLAMGCVAFIFIANAFGGLKAASEQINPNHLVRTLSEITTGTGATRQVGIPALTFLTYMFIPLSVGMFPHLFQHWLTAKNAKSFRLTVIAHPLCIMILWVPCVLIGLWSTGVFLENPSSVWPEKAREALRSLPDGRVGAVLTMTLNALVQNPVIVGLVGAGVLAAIMSSLDSQFLCLGTIFTSDIVLHNAKKKYSEKQIVFIARAFIVVIVALTYLISLVSKNNIFDLAVWSFAGFAALTPIVFAALYWKGATRAGAFASLAASMGTWMFFFWQSGWGGDYTVWGGIQPVALAWMAGAVAMIVVSLFTTKPSEDTLRKFFVS